MFSRRLFPLGKEVCNNFMTKRFMTSKEARSTALDYVDNGGVEQLHPDIKTFRDIVNKDIKWAAMRGLTDCRTCISDDRLSFNELRVLQRGLEEDGFEVKTKEYPNMYKIDVNWYGNPVLEDTFKMIGGGFFACGVALGLIGITSGMWESI
jgi:hypothetical protein